MPEDLNSPVICIFLETLQMRKIYGIGEALLDVIFKNNQPVSATAGGSTLNAIVSLGRMGHHPYFISEIGNDRIGDLIDTFLLDNGVSDQYLFRRDGTRSPLALAFLNEVNDAEYEIFKDYAAQALDGKMPDFKENDLVVFGSFFSLNPSVRPQLLKTLRLARDMGATIVYDPNYRNHHAHKIEQLKPMLEENFALAHIVRGSNEDFQNIYKTSDIDEMAVQVSKFCPNVVITAAAAGVYQFSANQKYHYPSRAIVPISTIGAGDNFNAGIVHALLKEHIATKEIDTLSSEKWQILVETAIGFASAVCCSMENYIPKNFKTS